MTQLTEEQILKEVDKLIGKKYHPILSKARNAVAMQQLCDDQIKKTIKEGGTVIVSRHKDRLVQMIKHSNEAMDQLAKHVCKDDTNALTDLIDALRGSDNSGLGN